MSAPNAALAWRVMDHIDAHPEQHDQGDWIVTDADCGTIACFAGWTCLLSGDSPAFSPRQDFEDEAKTSIVTVYEGGGPHDRSVGARAAELLGVNRDMAGRLFYAADREVLGQRVAWIFGPRPGEHVNCPHDPEGADGNPFAAMVCGPRPTSGESEQVLFIGQDGTAVDVTPEPDEDGGEDGHVTGGDR